ncbi:MAG: carbohydrate binding family 9 domain-containing protein [Bacteroidetes bacterium]|nr:carbohydrate binding family 9 domain-containing protein [Bacteroidota bacterium]MBU1719297.1 carbohydrate binding family 9 domain-containing protein [Bacteroidota bacterium]
MKNILLTGLVLLFLLPAFSQDKKTLTASRISEAPVIDGALEDSCWVNADFATDFTQYDPVNGANSAYHTRVRVVYDDHALYIAADMQDAFPDSILRELGLRDNDNLNSDYFWVTISPFNDGQNESMFMVSAGGVETDARLQDDFDDSSWDAVWKVKTAITQTGWVAEMMIPFSALRFPKTLGNAWGINFWRRVRRSRETSNWNQCDKAIGSNALQSGLLEGIVNVKPPLRLSFAPYFSAYTEHYPYNIPGMDNLSTYFNGGMDLKYGINESFTLDMTLIPDFGQVQSDEKVLNLSPYETKFTEKRSFFTEGTELFTRADLFYSRRIGSTPRDYYTAYQNLSEGESIHSADRENKLLNALKISGRTGKKTGLGLFNAVTSPSEAVITDSLSKTRDVVIQPLTNYNILVADQSFGRNSYLSLINTNLWYQDGKNLENVTGTEFRVSNKSNRYSISGHGAVSQCWSQGNDVEIGHKYQLNAGKTSGKFQAFLSNYSLSDTYDQNGIGYLSRNNVFQNSFNLIYNIYNPFWKLLYIVNSVSLNHTNLYAPREFSEFSVNAHTNFTFKNYLTFDFSGYAIPSESFDYYEPRKDGFFYRKSPEYYFGGWISSDYRKTIAIDAGWDYISQQTDDNQNYFGWRISPRLRVSNRMLLTYRFRKEESLHEKGFVTNTGDVIFGRRNVTRYTNTIEARYIFNIKLAATLRVRHYWSVAVYDDYFILDPNGYLLDCDYQGAHDLNYNSFNIDMGMVWRFAPGSELSFVWKNVIDRYTDQTRLDFLSNFEDTWSSQQLNTLSLKVVYYLDAMRFRRRQIENSN